MTVLRQCFDYAANESLTDQSLLCNGAVLACPERFDVAICKGRFKLQKHFPTHQSDLSSSAMSRLTDRFRLP
jgi:hypothetical protein